MKEELTHTGIVKCDECGLLTKIKAYQIVCELCKLKLQAAEALEKGWTNQYHMIQGMIKDEEKK